jgi:hypothetical protein
VDVLEIFRRAAIFVDNILKGANPGNPPIEQAAEIQLIINLKTAKALPPHDPAAGVSARGRTEPSFLFRDTFVPCIAIPVAHLRSSTVASSPKE